VASRDILQRFRPAGAPGAAAPPGVPADRGTEAAAELEPLLALLADTQAEAARIRAEAAQEAEHRRSLAADRAAALVVSARSRAAADRADAALRVSRAVAEESAAALADAHLTAGAVRQRASERMRPYLDRVMDATRRAMQSGGDA